MLKDMVQKNNLLRNLIIINLIFLGIFLFGKMVFLHRFIKILFKALLTPVIFSVFLFYIIKPINTIFMKKGLKSGMSALLTLIIGLFIAAGIISFFSSYIAIEFQGIIEKLVSIVKNRSSINQLMNKVDNYIPVNEVYKTGITIANTYRNSLVPNFMFAVNYAVQMFSMVFLMLVILFYLLKDGSGFKDKVICLFPEKYKEVISKTLSDSDRVLGAYVTGQAKVALSLSIMIFIGYKIIGIPNAMLFSTITFILAFIPFVGFFISMIIPTIIALSMGFVMLGKLLVVFIIVQTLKGRVVVPTIMGHAMKIHPLTDIFLVIGAIAVGGPLAAFAIVPVYAIIKVIVSNMYECHLIKPYNK
jgi:predicted PurR-regulated permease PerM